MSNFKYFFAVVFNKKHQFMHKCLYEDIEKLEVVAKKKYMSIGSPLAYEMFLILNSHLKMDKHFIFIGQ